MRKIEGERKVEEGRKEEEEKKEDAGRMILLRGKLKEGMKIKVRRVTEVEGIKMRKNNSLR